MYNCLMNGGFKYLGISCCSVLIVVHAAYVEDASELIFQFLPGRIVKESFQSHG